jgi:hypothetical protein
MAKGESWSVRGSYYESCNCEAVCPCRRLNGKAGGNMPFTSDIGTVIDVERAKISLVHEPGKESIRVGRAGASAVVRRADYEGAVSCGIPGHDHPGTEYVASLAVHDGPLQWDYKERCGFAADFHYHG